MDFKSEEMLKSKKIRESASLWWQGLLFTIHSSVWYWNVRLILSTSGNDTLSLSHFP